MERNARPISCWLVRKCVPHQINLSDQDSTANSHSHGDDGDVEPREITGPDVDVFAPQDIPPQKSGQGRTEGGTEGPVIDTESHAVDGGPECPVGYRGHSGLLVYEDPSLENSANEDGCSDVRARELVELLVSQQYSSSGARRQGIRCRERPTQTPYRQWHQLCQ